MCFKLFVLCALSTLVPHVDAVFVCLIGKKNCSTVPSCGMLNITHVSRIMFCVFYRHWCYMLMWFFVCFIGKRNCSVVLPCGMSNLICVMCHTSRAQTYHTCVSISLVCFTTSKHCMLHHESVRLLGIRGGHVV